MYTNVDVWRIIYALSLRHQVIPGSALSIWRAAITQSVPDPFGHNIRHVILNAWGYAHLTLPHNYDDILHTWRLRRFLFSRPVPDMSRRMFTYQVVQWHTNMRFWPRRNYSDRTNLTWIHINLGNIPDMWSGILGMNDIDTGFDTDPR